MTEPSITAPLERGTGLDAEPPGMTHRQVLEALSGILLGMFVSLLATSVVSSSLPRIITDLGGTQSAFTWVVTATLLTTTISTPIWGKLADLVNRKVLIQVALGITVVSSALAGLSHSTEMLIGMRALQGLGAGGLTALGAILIADIISARAWPVHGPHGRRDGREHGRRPAPGWCHHRLATDLACVLLRRAAVRDRRDRRAPAHAAPAGAAPSRREDRLPRRLLISVGIALLLLWITFAGSSFEWASWQTAAMVGAAVLALGLAIWVESRAAEPMIPLHLFRNRTLVLSVVASIAVGIAMFGTSVFLGQYMQLARGKSPTQSGLMTIPMILGVLVASAVSGQIITRTGHYKRFMIAGATTLTVGLA